MFGNSVQILKFQEKNGGADSLPHDHVYLGTGVQMFDSENENEKLGIARATPRFRNAPHGRFNDCRVVTWSHDDSNGQPVFQFEWVRLLLCFRAQLTLPNSSSSELVPQWSALHYPFLPCRSHANYISSGRFDLVLVREYENMHGHNTRQPELGLHEVEKMYGSQAQVC